MLDELDDLITAILDEYHRISGHRIGGVEFLRAGDLWVARVVDHNGKRTDYACNETQETAEAAGEDLLSVLSGMDRK